MSSSQAGRWTGRRAAGNLAVLALVAALATASPAPARAAGTIGPGPFGLTPTPTSGGQPRPYFNLTLGPGGSASDTAIISNEATRTQRLRITVSRGVTATNSGSAFESMTGSCAGPDCWVKGLPVMVTLTPGARKELGFRIAVPRRTRPGQYLAGLTAESAVRPRSVPVGSNGHASARAIIIDQVTVGVAVTVGSLAQLRTALSISAVSAGWIGSMPRLYIPVRNTGQTFVRATGRVTCSAGGRPHSYRVIMETVLPHGGAVLPVNARGLRTGRLPCTVRLADSAGTLFTWSGVVSVPARTVTKTYHPAKGVYVALPTNTIPPWAIVLIVIGSLLLIACLALLVRRRRQSGRRRRPAPPRVARKRRAPRPGV